MKTSTKPDQAPSSEWKPQAQSSEQVDQGLRKAFQQALKENAESPDFIAVPNRYSATPTMRMSLMKMISGDS